MSTPLGSSQWMYSSGEEVTQQSLKFNDDESQYLSWTPASTSNRKTFTWSGWVKLGSNIDAPNRTFSAVFDSSNYTRFTAPTSGVLSVYQKDSGSVTISVQSSQKLRDPSAWYHVVLSVDTTQATSTDRIKMYINGVEDTTLTGTYPSLNKLTYFCTSYQHQIGYDSATNSYMDGYLSDIHFIDGQALDPTSFGQFTNGYWEKKDYAGTYGTNGFHLEFDGAVTDSSGNGNDWTANNISAHDYVPDSPTNNFAVLNAVDKFGSQAVLKEGNLQFTKSTATGYYNTVTGTVGMPSGKWYWEVYMASSADAVIGVTTDPSVNDAVYGGSTSTSWAYINYNGQKRTNNSSSAYGATFAAGDIIGVALDMDSGTLEFYKNGASQGQAFTGITGTALPSLTDAGNTLTSVIANFGQDSTFAGATTAGGNTDANGIGDFKHPVPSGFLALATANLPTPTIVDGSEHFNTVLWTGNGTSQSITGVGFGSAPDLIWLKNRSGTDWHNLVDSVRGSSNRLSSNNTTVEYTDATIISSIDADGFSVGSNSNGNRSGNAFVGWNWKAGGTAVSNTAGSITSQVSANVDAGFSIVSYTGTGSAATIGHSLGVQPDMIIAKRRSGTDDWVCYHSALSSAKDKYIVLNSTNAAGTLSNFWGTGTPDSTTFGAAGGYAHNKSGSTYVAYCFANSDTTKVGSYTGNGSTDGPMVFTGFRPSFILTKQSDGISLWGISDSKRSPFNEVANTLAANESYTESVLTSDMNVDFLSNGFKIRDTYGQYNQSGGGYIYIAFAEHPFKYANAR